MKIAVVTPSYHTPADWLEQCLRSVAAQTVPCTHFVVNDGDPDLALPVQATLSLVSLPGPHRDWGNTARAVGSICAARQGFDAIAYLDADNWYHPGHLESLLRLHQRSGAAVCTSGRDLHHVDGARLGPCPEVDGRTFVDANCFFFTRAAFDLIRAWYLVPPGQDLVADRALWQHIVGSGRSRAHSGQATVAYRTAYKVHYHHFGAQPPPWAKVVDYDPHGPSWGIRHDAEVPRDGKVPPG